MTKEDQLRLCVMLAFQAKTSKGGLDASGNVDKIIELARLMNEFCDLHLEKTFPTEAIKLVDDKGAAETDAVLNQHKEELQKKEITQLPEDKETLIKFYDRLLQRKTRRAQWLFYAQASVEELADLVLKLLDEELEDANAGTVQ